MATTEKATTTAKAGDGVVKYTGTADEVKISAADWKRAKVEDQEQVVFNADNDFEVKASDLSASALKALAKDSRFQVPSTEA